MSENATPFGAFRVYLSSSATAGRSAPWPLAWPHVLTMDIEQGGAARAMPPETASDATMIAVAGVFLLFSSCASFAGRPSDRGRDPPRIVPYLYDAGMRPWIAGIGYRVPAKFRPHSARSAGGSARATP